MAQFAETLESTATTLVIAGVVTATPGQVYECFTHPDAITAWWAPDATTEPRVGGALVASWPDQGWTMRGAYTDLRPGRAVGFMWRWDHEHEAPPRHVGVDLEPAGNGTLVTLRHGDYTAGDQDERRGHLEGWLHFLPRLAARFE